MKPGENEKFKETVAEKEDRKIKAQKRPIRSIWFGFSLFGIVGWSVMVPAVLGALLGIWLDSKFSSQYSWTLSFLVFGIGLGALNAWYWIRKEGNEIKDDNHQENN
ncbi:AtpZ/AtpI family protein [Echinicola shivajiensis]|uniref:AtpZ/AtpI family protein n=1 Tax=Echinicola shivajiensis TaxID=1035916 RepID=UPI001BFC3031|nr:AtpZ/AtpI family protein [Echinicola shivajiensis]